MPIFEYRCKKCGEGYSELIYGDEKPTCPKCGGRSAEKQFSSFGVGGGSGSTPHSSTPPCASGGG